MFVDNGSYILYLCSTYSVTLCLTLSFKCGCVIWIVILMEIFFNIFWRPHHWRWSDVCSWLFPICCCSIQYMNTLLSYWRTNTIQVLPWQEDTKLWNLICYFSNNDNSVLTVRRVTRVLKPRVNGLCYFKNVLTILFCKVLYFLLQVNESVTQERRLNSNRNV